MNGDVQVRFCERLGVRFPGRLTLPVVTRERLRSRYHQMTEALYWRELPHSRQDQMACGGA